MCGLNGIFAFNRAAGPPTTIELLRTRDAMKLRGPDGEGEWWTADRRCGLGHRRLSFLDLSDRALQPMVSQEDGLAIVFNGEIYNYKALRGELLAEGASLETSSDTEILLKLYARYGADMVHRLRGMFAFAIWDGLRQGLFLARDPYGIKPLYYANDGWTFRFASQVKALLAGGEISRDVDPAGLIGFHLLGHVPEPFTLFREVRALPAGCTQWVDVAGPREPRRYASAAATLAGAHGQTFSKTEMKEQVRSSLLDSVRAHLVSDVEIGLFLSGGVDSGALLGLMQDAGFGSVQAVTLAFDQFEGTADDEGPLAAAVAQHYGARHTIRRIGHAEFLADLPAILDAMDQPSIDGVNTWFVAKAARELGLKGCLSGVGGDELLAGYSSFVEVPRWRRQLRVPAAIPGAGRAARLLLRSFAPELVNRQPKLQGMVTYGGSWEGAYFLRRALHLPEELSDFLNPDFVREGLRRLQPIRIVASALCPDPGSDIGRLCALESYNYLKNQLLRDADWAGMAHSVEIRTPLVDATLLAELSPIIPRLQPGLGKALLAAAPRRPLPDGIVRRAKTGFSVPTASWMASTSGFEARPETRGATSRRWSRVVLDAAGLAT